MWFIFGALETQFIGGQNTQMPPYTSFPVQH